MRFAYRRYGMSFVSSTPQTGQVPFKARRP